MAALTGRQLVNAHAALADAVATAQVLRRLLHVALDVDDVVGSRTRIVSISVVVQRIRWLRLERRERLREANVRIRRYFDESVHRVWFR